MDDTAMQPVSPGPRGRFGNNLWEAYSARIEVVPSFVEFR